MGWKDWPYWLRGGIIVVLIPVIIFLIVLIFEKISSSRDPTYYQGTHGTLAGYLLIALGLPINIIAPTLGEGTFIFLTAIMYFVIGAIIGLIVGKIKSKK